MVTRHVPSPRNNAVTRGNKTLPPFPRPLPTRPVPTRASAGCESCLRLRPFPRKNLLFFASLRASQYPTVTATSRRASSARFNGDIEHIIIDVSLFCRRVARKGRGCRPQRVDFRRNSLTRGGNALASTASLNDPITPALARGHLTTQWPASPASASPWGGVLQPSKRG